MDEIGGRILLPGRDISRRGQMKIARARELLAGLRGQMETWATTGAVYATPVLTHDRKAIEIRAVVKSPPPLDIWAMQFGEAVHQLRAALDALAWDCAHLDGKKPTRPSKVYFPLKDTPEKFASERTGVLSSIPVEILDRIELAQLYHNTPENPPFLGLLHNLDIQDKHRGLLSARMGLTGFELVGIQFEAIDFTETEVAAIRLRPMKMDEIVDGALLAVLELPRPLQPDALSPAPLAVVTDIVVVSEDGEFPFSYAATSFPEMTTTVYETICRGVDPGTGPDTWELQISS